MKIIGGLGNQMFQYALGRQLAILNNCELKLDITDYETYKLHKYGLNNFSIQASVAGPKEILRHDETRLQALQRKILSHLHRTQRTTNLKRVTEKNLMFDPAILRLQGDIYLSGYWGSEKYFLQAEATIRKDFTLVPTQDEANERMSSLIENTEAVAVHIRRGDYVTNATTNKFHGTCTIDYYLEAARKIVEHVANPTFFIFSDDMSWVQKNLTLTNPMHYVSINGPDKNFEDLRLMSQCKHHIIANSTFSWWGAWLAKHPKQKVIAPLKWFNDPTVTTDLVPESWVRV